MKQDKKTSPNPQSTNPQIHQSTSPQILGIRHHGTGSARRVQRYLEALRPDLVLIEGPPDFDDLLHWVKPGALEPPVALLGYNKDAPQQASFYPFAEYSPEWQAILYANTHKVPVAMLDLPLAQSMELPQAAPVAIARDPMSYLAQIEGFSNSEAWWEHRFERHRSDMDDATYFDAVMVAMTALREANLPSSMEQENLYREAWMRQILREALQKMFANVVVVCGAWHAPALLDLAKKEKTDRALLKTLPKPKIKISATWVPWTNDRLSIRSGYGAGVHTPGWSEHCWHYPTETGVQWLSAVAAQFRSKRMDISTAHVLEAYRLADTLAAMRGLSAPALEEYNEATVTVMCMGDRVQLDWLKQTLLVGNRMGKVPDKLPKLPLQADFEQQIKRLRLKLSEEPKTMELDLREERDLEKSVFLHRTLCLGLRWGEVSVPDGAKGTFREGWSLAWSPEIEVELITRGTWGNTVEDAALNWVRHRTDVATQIESLTQLLENAMPGALYAVVDYILQRLNDLAARSTDVADLMGVVPSFARALRYGNVRKTDKTAIEILLDGLLTRIGVGLPQAVYGVDDDTAIQMFRKMEGVQAALGTVERPDWVQVWQTALNQLPGNGHPLLLGYAARVLFDAGAITGLPMEQRFSQALSRGNSPAYAAAWLEGFLRGSATILLYDNTLWHLLYRWSAELPETDFRQLLPVLRRTFAVFEPSERRRLGEKAKAGLSTTAVAIETRQAQDSAAFDPQRAQKVAEAIVQWLY